MTESEKLQVITFKFHGDEREVQKILYAMNKLKAGIRDKESAQISRR
jgi:hypothetical protein